jgi:hypothetical protein
MSPPLHPELTLFPTPTRVSARHQPLSPGMYIVNKPHIDDR